MALTEHNIEELKTRIIEALASDSFLCRFWSGKPECDVFPHEDSDYFKHVLVTVFLKVGVLNGGNVEAIIKRLVALVRPHIELVDELCALALWIGAGDTSDSYFRVLRLSILKEAMDSPLLDSLTCQFTEEYFDDGGISFLRYYPL